MAFKIDLNKAYDRVEWDFLIATMTKLGFKKKWTDFIFQYASSISYRALINGEPSNSFVPKRGLRQREDPLITPALRKCDKVSCTNRKRYQH